MWAALLPILGKVLDLVIPDPQQAAEIKLRTFEMAQRGELAQLDAEVRLATNQAEINKIEAASDSLFKSGWRPAVGWICVSGLLYQVWIQTMLGWIAKNLWSWTPPPSLDMESLGTLLFGMLGLGAFRTYEKLKTRIPPS